MKIAILTFHRANNCGAVLQAWALQVVLQRMGHDVEFPNCNSVGCFKGRWNARTYRPQHDGLRSILPLVLINLLSIGLFERTRARFRNFRSRFLRLSLCGKTELDRYDVLVYGSDQIWNPCITKEDTDLFLGKFGAHVRKIVYAASAGDRVPENLKEICDAMSRFSAVSVREPFLSQSLLDRNGQRPAVVLDPALLLDVDSYKKVAAPVKETGPYLFAYALDAGKEQVFVSRRIAKALGLKLIFASGQGYTCYRRPMADVIYGVSPDMLVGFSQHCAAMMTWSFHGTVFGLLSRKPFVSWRDSNNDRLSRPASLLMKLGCEERIVSCENSIDEIVALLRKPVGEDVYARLEQRRADSMEWLREQLGCSKSCNEVS